MSRVADDVTIATSTQRLARSGWTKIDSANLPDRFFTLRRAKRQGARRRRYENADHAFHAMRCALPTSHNARGRERCVFTDQSTKHL